MANKCPETLGNKGLSGTLRFDEKGFATNIKKDLMKHVCVAS